jgi:hypothetical protein
MNYIIKKKAPAPIDKRLGVLILSPKECINCGSILLGDYPCKLCKEDRDPETLDHSPRIESQQAMNIQRAGSFRAKKKKEETGCQCVIN